MNWLAALLQNPSVLHDVLLLAITAGSGLALGRLRVAGVGLGVAGTLFTGILLSHFGLRLDPAVLAFVRDFGLVLFVYAIGMQVGPGFLATLRSQGLSWNLLAVFLILTGTALSIGLGLVFATGTPVSLGILAGAANNMPSLGAASQALSGLPGWNHALGRDMTLACAVTYPFGIVGLLLVMLLLRFFGRIRIPAEVHRFEEAMRSGPLLSSMSLVLENPALFGQKVSDIPALAERGAVVTRLLRAGKLSISHPEDVLQEGDVLHVVGPGDAVSDLVKIVGHQAELDLREAPGDLSAIRIVASRAKVCGRSLRELQLQERFGVAISRVERGDMVLSGGPDTRILFADRLVAVGATEGLEAAAKELGNSERVSNQPQVLPLFLGILAGALLGGLPIAIPGVPMPVRLGLAGGPLIASIVLARLRRIGPVDFYLPVPASLLLRDLGVTLFLSCVGLMSGEGFFECLRSGPGLMWAALGVAVTFVPALLAALIGRCLLKIDFLSLCGLLSGATTCPPALAFAGTFAPGCEAAAVASATVYPITMLLRVALAQTIALLLR